MTVESKPNKLLAEWFWTDRWMGSSAFLLPLEPRGLYREMLTQAWRRGASLPADHEAIRRAVGCTLQEWNRCWPKVSGYWRVEGDTIVNDTQVAVYLEAKAVQERASSRGRAGAQARAQALAQAEREEALKAQPPSPSPSPIHDLPRRSAEDRVTPARGMTSGVMAGGLQRDHLRHIGPCGRVCVPEFLHAQFLRQLGGEPGLADDRLRTFYKDTLAAIPDDQVIGDEPIDFWRRHFAAAHPSASPAGKRTPARPSHTPADVDKYAGIGVRDEDLRDDK